MLTPKRVIHPSSPNLAEILVACEDENGNPTNVTVVDEDLGTELVETPAVIPNPAYQPLIDQALALAAAKIAADAEGANG